VRFASFLSGEFITIAVMNPPEETGKTHWTKLGFTTFLSNEFAIDYVVNQPERKMVNNTTSLMR
jgi:hypothetical protein